MPTSAPYLSTARQRPRGTHHRIDPVGVGALLVASLGLLTTVLLLKPYAPTNHANTGGRADAHT
jgi:hypothetical protein